MKVITHMKTKPTLEKLSLLWAVCEMWRNRHKPTCPESIQQVDSINLACPDLAEEVCDIIGYTTEEELFEEK
jgi:hypothetical protein